MAMKQASSLEMAVVFVVFFSALSVAKAASGTATYYNSPYTPTACGDNNVPGDYMFAAGSGPIFDNGNGCGTTYTIKCLRANNQGPYGCTGSPGPYKIKIVDLCPDGCNGTFDLPAELFAKMADPRAGNIAVEYNKV